MKKNFFIVLVLAVFSFGCDPSAGNGPEAPQTGLSEPAPDGVEPVVRFNDVNNAVFKTSCAGCHTNRGLQLNFADFANTKSFAAEIFDRVFVSRDMPPNRKLTQVQEQVLRTWLEAGSPE